MAGTLTDYIDGARLYLESESDKELVPSVREIKTFFSSFIKGLIASFSRKTPSLKNLRVCVVDLLKLESGCCSCERMNIRGSK